MINDEDLSERAKRILGDLGDGSPIGDMTAALDEIERLRAELAAERAAVVAWLRSEADSANGAYDLALRGLADAIGRGEHLRAGGAE